MTRATMQLALDALDTCDAHLEVSGMNYGYYFNQEAVHNAVKALATALAQTEPSPIAYGVRQIGAKHVQYFTHSKEAALKAMEKTPNCEAVALGEVSQ